MKLLPLTFLRGADLRPAYQWLGAIFLLIGIVPSLTLTALAAWGLAVWLHLRMDVPVLEMSLQEQVRGWLWLGLTAASGVISTVVLYLGSFVAFAGVLRYAYHWPAARLRALMFESRMPNHWLNPPQAEILVPPHLQAARTAYLAQMALWTERAKLFRRWLMFVVTPASVFTWAWSLHLKAQSWLALRHASLPAARALARRELLFSLSLTLVLYMVFLTGTLWWGWRIAARYAPKCGQCQRRFLAVQERARVLATGQCPHCGHLFSAAPAGATVESSPGHIRG